MQAGSNPTVSYGLDCDDEVQLACNGTFTPASSCSSTATCSSGLSAAGTYDSDGRRTCLTLPNGVVGTFGYDNDSRMTGMNYYGAGTCANPSNSLGNLTYAYDVDSKITGVGGSLAAVNVPGAVTATYDSTNQVKTWNGTNASTDAANNLKTDPTNGSTYKWDERNQLSSVNSTSYTFAYDAKGRRELFDDFGVNQTYVYDGLMGVQETSSNTSTVPNQAYLTTPGGEVLAYSATANNTTTTSVPLHDIVGSTIGLVNAAASIATTFTYEPFGAVTAGGSGTTYPYMFAGMEYDAGTGLYHTLARYYSPRLQRFLSEDPLQYGGGQLNLFGYVRNSPVNGTDPLGLDGFCAYGWAGPVVSESTDFNPFIGPGIPASLGADVSGSVGIGGPGAQGGLGRLMSGGGAGPTMRQVGVDPGQIVLANYTVPLPPGTDPETAELGILGIAAPDAELGAEAALTLKALGRPAWAETPGGFVNWIEQLGLRLRSEGARLTAGQADAVIEEAKRLGVEVRATAEDLAGHERTGWSMPHVNIGRKQVHIPVPDGYVPNKSLP